MISVVLASSLLLGACGASSSSSISSSDAASTATSPVTSTSSSEGVGPLTSTSGQGSGSSTTTPAAGSIGPEDVPLDKHFVIQLDVGTPVVPFHTVSFGDTGL